MNRRIEGVYRVRGLEVRARLVGLVAPQRPLSLADASGLMARAPYRAHAGTRASAGTQPTPARRLRASTARGAWPPNIYPRGSVSAPSRHYPETQPGPVLNLYLRRSGSFCVVIPEIDILASGAAHAQAPQTVFRIPRLRRATTFRRQAAHSHAIEEARLVRPEARENWRLEQRVHRSSLRQRRSNVNDVAAGARLRGLIAAIDFT